MTIELEFSFARGNITDTVVYEIAVKVLSESLYIPDFNRTKTVTRK